MYVNFKKWTYGSESELLHVKGFVKYSKNTKIKLLELSVGEDPAVLKR